MKSFHLCRITIIALRNINEIKYKIFRVCMCIWERQKAREKNPLKRPNGLKTVWYLTIGRVLKGEY